MDNQLEKRISAERDTFGNRSIAGHIVGVVDLNAELDLWVVNGVLVKHLLLELVVGSRPGDARKLIVRDGLASRMSHDGFHRNDLCSLLSDRGSARVFAFLGLAHESQYSASGRDLQ